MTKGLSKTQGDRLGDRLRKGDISEADLRLLDQYRRSFTEAYEIVVGAIRRELGLEPTGRPAKSTTSISDKLRRESIRLTQIQDIAGCRLIASDIAEQDMVVQSLGRLFEHITVVDHRHQPSHGYRAVHVIATCRGTLIEIQVRTSLQHLWAELSEKFSDVIDPAIKYGGGDKDIREILALLSAAVDSAELLEVELAATRAQFSSRGSLEDVDKQKAIDEIQKGAVSVRQDLFNLLRRLADNPPMLNGGNDALSD